MCFCIQNISTFATEIFYTLISLSGEPSAAYLRGVFHLCEIPIRYAMCGELSESLFIEPRICGSMRHESYLCRNNH